MTYGAHDILRDVIVDLRDYPELTDLLEDRTAITEGWPRDSQRYGVVIRVQPITETSSREFGQIERTFRLQFAVVATDEWRSDRQNPTYDMAKIMTHVSDRLDGGLSIDDVLPGETASGSWQEVEGGRIALIQDWRQTSIQ